MTRTVIIPCYNEARRLDASSVLELAAAPGLTVLFVDDGSTDNSLELIDTIAARAGGAVRVVRLPHNAGKGEAVRTGLLHALHEGSSVVGYLDADFSSPPSEMLRVLGALDDPQVEVAMGARVQLLGRRIERKPLRHYLGRVFATASSMALAVPVYDTQCGAKAFRATPALRTALLQPFVSRWAFDVELLGRLLRGGEGIEAVPVERFLEVPLTTWRDVGGSRLSSSAMVRAAADLWKIGRGLRKK